MSVNQIPFCWWKWCPLLLINAVKEFKCLDSKYCTVRDYVTHAVTVKGLPCGTCVPSALGIFLEIVYILLAEVCVPNAKISPCSY